QGCCGPKASCCGTDSQYSMIGDDYKNLVGYFQEADMGLGCGLPTEFANIKQGDVVLDLGCGAGNDVFIARNYVGENGKVIGIDMTEEMIQKANINKEKLGYKNVEFRLGEIENLPVENESIDVVISNCVLNLVPDKKKAFSEIYRVLKPSGYFCISDIVVEGELPVELKKSAELYVGCVAGALQKNEYIKIILETNFKNIIIKKEKKISLPESLLKNFLYEKELMNFLKSNSGIVSITIYGEK
ncbi:MAG: arsenite methyltransferase, partial [Melioribacter sp.]|nr:arsenite methyltransferase [Melioribacter sp.]